MEKWICMTCGTQFPQSEQPPSACPICVDERQYIGHDGQQWTTHSAMLTNGFHNQLKEHETHILGIGTAPRFAIGQRAILILTPQGNVLWDCISLLDTKTFEAIQQLGGIQAIAISHPHYYTTMVDWSERFQAPIYLHEADRQWVMRPGASIIFWSGEIHPLFNDLTLLRLGGHFPGSAVLHWRSAADGQGVLFTGDTIYVAADRRWASFMYSYPNLIPLPAPEISRIRAAIAPYQFERLYAAWFDAIIPFDAHEVVLKSADRYLYALQGPLYSL